MEKNTDIQKNIDTVLVLDFGGQYAHLIGRRIREQKVYSKVIPCNTTLKHIKSLKEKHNIKGIILSGGPASVYEEASPEFNSKILDFNLPIFGICYGHQLLAEKAGGEIKKGAKGEFGIVKPEILKSQDILKGITGKIKGWTSHKDNIHKLPSEYEILAKTKNCPIAAYANKKDSIYGMQWHPEVTHSEYGDKIFRNFLFRICECEKEWEMKNFVEKTIDSIKEEVGNKKSIIGVSGGVDSTTAAVLSSEALGENLIAVFVDHGLLRKNERKKVKKTLNNYKLNLKTLDERERFFYKLKGIVDPEKKRKIIGEEFIRIFEDVAREEEADYLIQGTIYPDWIESGSETHSAKIKSHHNVGGLPSEMDFEGIIEPLRYLYKDEVREVGESLGLPENMVWRQPFPGPGLGVRVMGEVTPSKVEILKEADWIFREEVDKASLDNLWQYFSVLLSTKSTGVKGDDRDYGYVIGIRAVESTEAMTANFAKLPYEFLEQVSNRIVNEISEATRVVYDITHKPPATIEWE